MGICLSKGPVKMDDRVETRRELQGADETKIVLMTTETKEEAEFFLNKAELELGIVLDSTADHCYWEFYRQKNQTKLNLEKIPSRWSRSEFESQVFNLVYPAMNRILDYLPEMTWPSLRTVSKPMNDLILRRLFGLTELSSGSQEILAHQRCSSCILRRFRLMRSRCPSLETLPRQFENLTQHYGGFERLKDLYLNISDDQDRFCYSPEAIRSELLGRAEDLVNLYVRTRTGIELGIDIRPAFNKVYLPQLQMLSFRDLRFYEGPLLRKDGEVFMPQLRHFEFPEEYCCSYKEVTRLSKYPCLESIFMPTTCPQLTGSHIGARVPPMPQLKAINIGHTMDEHEWRDFFRGSPNLESVAIPDEEIPSDILKFIANATNLRKLSLPIQSYFDEAIQKICSRSSFRQLKSNLTHLSISIEKSDYNSASAAFNRMPNLKYLHVETLLDEAEPDEVEVLKLEVPLETLCLTYTLLEGSTAPLSTIGFEFSQALEDSLRTLKLSVHDLSGDRITDEGGQFSFEDRLLIMALRCLYLREIEIYDPLGFLLKLTKVFLEFHEKYGRASKKIHQTKPDFSVPL